MNEKKFAEILLEGRMYGENYSYTTVVLAKYYKSLGYNKEEIKTNLERIMEERIPFAAKQSKKTVGQKGVRYSRETSVIRGR